MTVSFDENILLVTVPSTDPPTVVVSPNVNEISIAASGLQGPAYTPAYVFTQITPSDTWVIEHSLGWNPNVTVIDSAGTNVEGDIEYVSENSITLTFVSGFSGTAYLS